MAEIIIGDYKYYVYESGNAWVRVVDKTKSSYDNIPNTITYDGRTYTVTDMEQCFYGCSSLVTAPAIPSTVTNMHSCFYGCSSLTAAPIIPNGVTNLKFCFSGCSSLATAPIIPNGVTNMNACFQRCRSLVTAPTIPASVTDMGYCFGGCTSLAGNIFVKNNPTVYEYIFTSDVVNPIFIKPDTGITPEGIAKWRTIADLYSNVTLISPSITFQTFTAYRVEHQNDITQYEEGTYTLLQIQYTSDLPTGGSIIKNVTANGSVITPAWTESTNDGITVGRAWVSQATSNQVTYMISLSDSDGVTESETKSFTVVKVEALIDFLDGSQGMGIAFGTIATQPGFECAMDALFKQSVVVERLVGEIKMFAGTTIPTGWLLCDGTELEIADYPLLYNAIGDIWGVASDSDHFKLPNLIGRVPVGATPVGTTEWVMITGENAASEFTLTTPTYARWGTGTSWLYTTMPAGTYTPTYQNMNALFGGDPASGQAKTLHVALNVANNGGYSQWKQMINDMPSHNHTQDAHSHQVDNYVSSGSSAAWTLENVNKKHNYDHWTGSAQPTIHNTGGGSFISQMPPFAVVNYIICAA